MSDYPMIPEASEKYRTNARIALEATHTLAEAWEVGFQKGVEFSDWVGDLDSAKPDYANPYRSQS